MSDHLKVVEIKRDENALAKARQLVADIESGEVIAFTVISEHKGGGYKTGGTSVMSRLQMAGALFEAALDRLGFQSE